MIESDFIFNILRPRQNERHFADDIFKCILLNENVWIPIKISTKFSPKGPINNILALVEIMSWRRPGDKSLSEPMMVSLLTHICVTQPYWVNRKVVVCFIIFTLTMRIISCCDTNKLPPATPPPPPPPHTHTHTQPPYPPHHTTPPPHPTHTEWKK